MRKTRKIYGKGFGSNVWFRLKLKRSITKAMVIKITLFKKGSLLFNHSANSLRSSIKQEFWFFFTPAGVSWDITLPKLQCFPVFKSISTGKSKSCCSSIDQAFLTKKNWITWTIVIKVSFIFWSCIFTKLEEHCYFLSLHRNNSILL